MKTAHWHALLLAGAGVMHFKAPQVYDAIVPRSLPGNARTYTLVSGAAELAIAAGLALPLATGWLGCERVVCRGLPRKHQDGRGLSQGRKACGRTGTCVCSTAASDSSDSRGVEGVSRKVGASVTHLLPLRGIEARRRELTQVLFEPCRLSL